MKKNDNKTKNLTSILYYFSALCFYVASIFSFIDKNNSMGIIDLCLGSTFFCLGSIYLNKDKKL